MENRYATAPEMIPGMDTAELRARYLVDGLFQPDAATFVYSHQDRVIVLGLAPVEAPVELTAPAELRASFFCERRELGLVNVGGPGTVEADGVAHHLPHGACLYLTRGTKRVMAASDAATEPALFYGFSAPAHRAYENRLVLPGQGNVRELGEVTSANVRTLNQYIHPDVMPSAQISMGVTTLHPGSVWNTLPAHTHDRRMEAYLYFDLPEDQRVIHLMGTPTQTRHLVVANRQGVIAPSWSVHAGAGTAAYSFVWAMAGENQDFDDMDTFPVSEMR
jgi:4-deoxy-L-threo-5-hexosulose-uronate ketol-isomerase